jgi:acetylornithine/N-succinyldiaminopimelate aminotransferase
LADTPTTTKTDAIVQRHDAHMTLNYPRWPIAIESGSGCKLVDVEGREILDLFSGFGAGILGHCHEDLVTAATKQANKLWHVGNLLHTEPQTQLAQQIAEKGFGGRSFFSHSGADANEAAVKLARLYGKANTGKSTHEFGRFKVISTTRSFHGRSFATMGATGSEAVRQGFEPLLPGFVNVDYNDIDAVKAELDETTIAIIAEPIQGEGGVNVPDEKYFGQLRALCDEARPAADRRRSVDRLRADGQVVCLSALGRGTGHHDARQGHRLRAGGGCDVRQRSDGGDV